MSAEMKRASREGAESFRLIDEALGIHVSRPLTRILTQEFPALASTLQSLLGVGVAGALGVALFEGVEKGIEKIEQAQKAEEELAAASRKVGETFDDAMQSYEKADKLRSLSGLDKTLFQIDYSAVDEGRKKIDDLAAAMEKETAAAVEAHKWTTELFASVGDAAHQGFSTQSTLGVEQIGKQLTDFKQRFDELSKLDALHQTNESAKFVNETLAAATSKLQTMQAAKPLSFLDNVLPTAVGPKGFSEAEIAAQKEWIDRLTQISELSKAIGDDQHARENEAAKADYAERQLKAQEAIAALQKDIGAGLGKFFPQTDPFQKLMTEVTGFREQAANDFRAIQESTTNALDLKMAQQHLEEYSHRLDEVVAKARLDADIANAQAALAKIPIAGAPLPAGMAQTPNIPLPTLQLAPQLADLAELKKVQTDANEAWAEAGKILASIETPEQKYEAGLRTLQTLEEQGRITTEQFAAAHQKLQEELAESTNKLELLLRKTGDAGAGFQAFIMQIERSGNQQGAFTFDILNKGLQGFEDQTAQALTGGKTSWSKYFEEIDQMALEFVLNKGIASLLQSSGIGNLFGPPQPGQTGGTSNGTSLGGGAPLSPLDIGER